MKRSTTAPFIGCLAIAVSASCSSASTDPFPAESGGGGGSSAGGAGGSTTSGSGGSTTSGSGGSTSSGSGGDGAAGDTAGVGVSGNGGSSGSDGLGGSNAGGSAGQGGTTTPDDAGSGPPANCPNGALLCEDFETYAPMAGPTGKWTSRMSGGGTVVVDTEHAHSGTKAVHFHGTTVNNNTRAYILTQGAPVFPVAGNQLFVRFMLYIGRYTSVTGTGVHNRLAWVGSAATLASGGNGPGYSFVTFNGIAIERLTNPSQGFQRDTTQHMDDAARANRWQCFEFEIDNTGGVPPGEQASSTTMPHIWQEGQPLKLSAGGSSEPWLPAPFEALQFSLWCPQTDPMPTDYWIDDVVMSNQRINCPPAP